MWGRREISLEIKIKVFNVIVLSVLLYGAAALALAITDRRKKIRCL